MKIVDKSGSHMTQRDIEIIKMGIKGGRVGKGFFGIKGSKNFYEITKTGKDRYEVLRESVYRNDYGARRIKKSRFKFRVVK